jgi:hypothetical protein
MTFGLRGLVVCCVMGAAVAARADEPAGVVEPPQAEEHPRRVFALTISPLHLISPIVELTGEARVADKIGVAAIAGVGRISDTQNGVKISADVYELGAQARYYALGDFRQGMQLGAELLYLHLDDPNLVVKAQGIAVGPFVGYKYTADVGFTFDGQLGVEYVGAKANSSTTTAKDSSWIPLLNLNVGWSL